MSKTWTFIGGMLSGIFGVFTTTFVPTELEVSVLAAADFGKQQQVGFQWGMLRLKLCHNESSG